MRFHDWGIGQTEEKLTLTGVPHQQAVEDFNSLLSRSIQGFGMVDVQSEWLMRIVIVR